MKLMTFLITAVIVMFLAGCAGETEPTLSEPESQPTTDSPALSTAAPTETAVPLPDTPIPDDAESVELDDDTSLEPAGSDPAATPVPGDTEAVEPVTVDLGELTPVPPRDDEPQEMPKPGVPLPGGEATQKAIEDLAKTQEVEANEIAIVSVESAEWTSSALGCPKAGMGYLDVMTPGYKIILEANGQQFEYHTNDNGSMITLCP